MYSQCLHKWWDAKEIFSWHTVNAGKYISSIVVVIYALATKDQTSAIYFLIVVVATLYKWWWDIAFDWKLWAVFRISYAVSVRARKMCF